MERRLRLVLHLQSLVVTKHSPSASTLSLESTPVWFHHLPQPPPANPHPQVNGSMKGDPSPLGDPLPQGHTPPPTTSSSSRRGKKRGNGGGSEKTAGRAGLHVNLDVAISHRTLAPSARNLAKFVLNRCWFTNLPHWHNHPTRLNHPVCHTTCLTNPWQTKLPHGVMLLMFNYCTSNWLRESAVSTPWPKLLYSPPPGTGVSRAGANEGRRKRRFTDDPHPESTRGQKGKDDGPTHIPDPDAPTTYLPEKGHTEFIAPRKLPRVGSPVAFRPPLGTPTLPVGAGACDGVISPPPRAQRLRRRKISARTWKWQISAGTTEGLC